MAKYKIKKGVGIIPKRTQNLEDHAFSECKDLTCVDIPDSVERIGENAFSYWIDGMYYHDVCMVKISN